MTPLTVLLSRTIDFFGTSVPCVLQKPNFFGLPTWYSYLKGKTDLVDPNKCIPDITGFNQIPAIGLAIVDILLHVAGLIALAYILYGAFLYVTSRGEPDQINNAKSTILNAVIGLVIVLIAITAVAFIGGKLA